MLRVGIDLETIFIIVTSFWHHFQYLFGIDFCIYLCIDFEAFLIQKWLPRSVLGQHFLPNGRKMCNPPNECGHPFADPAPHDPERPFKNTFGLIWVGFGPILDNCLKKLKGLGRCCINFDLICVHFGPLRAGFLHCLRPSNSPKHSK